uniref:NADH dehydrogenase subunit 2 n=1 Tax=Heterorhabditis bacteriophora TaxID=37862 RepID=A0A1I7WKN9_HETBA
MVEAVYELAEFVLHRGVILSVLIIAFESCVFFIQSYIFSRLVYLYLSDAKLLIWKWVSHILLLHKKCICFKYKSTNESNASLLNLFEVFTCSFLFLFCLFFVLYLTLISVMLLIFLLITIIFILLNKGNKSYRGIFNYFVIQETLGLLFLVFSSNYIQFIILIMKIGVAPFHFWVFSVTNSIFNYGLVWFLTIQKLPLMVVLLQLFASDIVYLFLFGLFICYLQMFMLKGYKNLLIVSSTESFN